VNHFLGVIPFAYEICFHAVISFEFLNLGEIKNSELTGSGRCTVQSGVSWKKSFPEPSRERTFNAVQRNRAAKKRRQSRPNPFTGSV